MKSGAFWCVDKIERLTGKKSPIKSAYELWDIEQIQSALNVSLLSFACNVCKKSQIFTNARDKTNVIQSGIISFSPKIHGIHIMIINAEIRIVGAKTENIVLRLTRADISFVSIIKTKAQKIIPINIIQSSHVLVV